MEDHLIYFYHASFPAEYLRSMSRTGAPTGSITLKRLPIHGYNMNTPIQRSQFWDTLACIFAYIVSGDANIGYLQQSLEIPVPKPRVSLGTIQEIDEIELVSPKTWISHRFQECKAPRPLRLRSRTPSPLRNMCALDDVDGEEVVSPISPMSPTWKTSGIRAKRPSPYPLVGGVAPGMENVPRLKR